MTFPFGAWGLSSEGFSCPPPCRPPPLPPLGPPLHNKRLLTQEAIKTLICLHIRKHSARLQAVEVVLMWGGSDTHLGCGRSQSDQSYQFPGTHGPPAVHYLTKQMEILHQTMCSRKPDGMISGRTWHGAVRPNIRRHFLCVASSSMFLFSHMDLSQSAVISGGRS